MDGPSITVAQLLGDPALRGMRLLAGAAGLAAPVEAVRMAEDGSGRFAPRTLYVLWRDEALEAPTIDVILRRAAAASAAGVAVRLGPDRASRPTPLPLATLVLSDRLKLPLVDVGAVDPMSLAERLATLRHGDREADYRRIEAAVAVALDEWREWQPAESILERLESALDVRCELVPMGSEAPEAGRAPEAGGRGRAPRVRSFGERVELVCHLYVGRRPRYELRVSFREDPHLRFVVPRVFDIVSALLEAQLAERHRSWESRMTFKQDFFTQIFSGGQPPPEVVARAMELGWDFGREHVVVAIRMAVEVGGAAGDEGSWLRASGELVDALEKLARAHELWAFAGPLEGRTFVCVFRPSVRSRLDLAKVRKTLAAVQQSLGGERRVAVTAGIGSVAVGLQGLARSYREALQALSIGGVVHGPGAIVTSDELGPERHLYPWYLSEEGQAMSAALLRPFLELPAARRQAALQTLDAFLRSGGTVAQVAESLNIHRNTARYRLAQLEKLLRLDLGDPENRLLLTLALRAYHAARG
ncbi:MAG: helix-turn-helix domain-containing protein [Clostridia bacterium]|nr:helix-turn-helix domain-containing protein [Clostridia bacterium]